MDIAMVDARYPTAVLWSMASHPVAKESSPLRKLWDRGPQYISESRKGRQITYPYDCSPRFEHSGISIEVSVAPAGAL